MASASLRVPDEQSRRKVVEIAPPSLPFVRCAGRLIEHVLDPSFIQRFVKRHDACVHAFGLRRANAQPQKMNLLGKFRWIAEDSVKSGLEVGGIASKHESGSSTTEAADIRKSLQVIQGDLEGLHRPIDKPAMARCSRSGTVRYV